MHLQHRVPRWKWAAFGLLGATTVALGATVAFADDGGDTTYYACVNNSSGTIKVVAESTSCSNNEHKIEWNREGPAGPAGEAGQPGPAGQDGSNGLSQAYVMRTAVNGFQQTSETGSSLVVAQLRNVPAGSYVVTAEETTTFPAALPGGEVTCTLTPGGAHGIAGVDAVEGIAHLSGQRANVVVTDGITLVDAGDISYSCSGPVGLSSDNAVLTAIRVDLLTVQAPTPPAPAAAGSLQASLDGVYPGHTDACTLHVEGSNLKPGSSLLVTVDDGVTFSLMGFDGPITVNWDGTVNATTLFGFTHDITITGTGMNGLPVTVDLAVTAACEGSAS